MQKYKMRKIFTVFVSLCILSIFAGCSGANVSNNINNSGAIEEIVNASDNGYKSNFRDIISSYETEYSDDYSGRIHNIKLAADSINGKIINSGEIFSFNKSVGNTEKDDGYKKAIVFQDGKKVQGYGGGVCQVSSTIYNTALNANLEIVERYPHGQRVYYVPKGKDAMTSQMDNIDLKFKNSYEYPIKILSSASDGVLKISFAK